MARTPSDRATVLRSLLTTALSLALACGVLAQSGGQIVYVYDEAGRLVAVIDPAGDAAVYSYDALGNLLSISRHVSTAASIIEFSPNGGPVGSAVTIYGTGFSATPGQNSVSFNGTAAAVTSATATQLVTSVPAGATTGAISVTTPAGTATSAAPFTVGASDVPTITGFTPTIATPGTAVTISGTNFESDIPKNRVKFNSALALPTAAAATSITAAVPGIAGSGRVTVQTVAGAATSASDFFVPPPPYTASNVAHTGRMQPGNTSAVALGASNKIGLVVFDVAPGQRAGVRVTGSTVTACKIAVLNPDATESNSMVVPTSGGFLDTTNLNGPGSYTILVDPESTYTGSLNLTLYASDDVTGQITPGGAPVAVATTVPAQVARLNFDGTAGQRVSLKITGVTSSGGNGWVDVAIRKPDGTNLTSTTIGASGGYLDTQTLPVGGIYSVVFNPQGITTAGGTLTLYDVPADISGPITPGGSAVTVTTTVPGQNGALTFSGTVGQRVSLRASGVSMNGNGWVTVALKKPDGTNLASDVFDSSGGFIDTQTLPVAGTYTVLVDPYSTNTGTAAVTLYDVPADITDSITPGGSPVTVTTTAPGQNASLAFGGTAGQRVSLRVSGVTMNGNGWVNVYLRKPDGTNLASDTFGTGGGFIDVQTLPVTGTYTVFVDPYKNNTGGATVTLYDVPANATGTINAGGSAVTVTTTAPGQNASLTFGGSAGQRVSLRVTGVSMTGNGWVNVYLKKPDGTNIVSNTFDSSGGFFDVRTLATTGTYSILVDPWSSNTGSATLTLYDVPADAAAAVTVNGGAATVTTTVPGQNAAVTFAGTAGQQVTVRMTGNGIGIVTVRLLRPDGTQVTSTMSQSSSFNLSAQTLNVTGTYTVTVDPSGTAAGGISVSVTNP